MPHFGRRKVRAEQLRHAGKVAVRHDCYAFDLLVVVADKVHVRGEAAEVLPSRKALRMNQYAFEFGVVGEIAIDSSAETAEILFAQRSAGFEQAASNLKCNTSSHKVCT